MKAITYIFQYVITAIVISTSAIAGSEGTSITPEDWRELTAGKTVYYSIAGQYYGREYYVPGTNLVYFEHNDGTCLSGVWSYEAPWYSFAFSYYGERLPPHRFLHQQLADLIVIISDDPDLPNQLVDRIILAPFTCEAEVTS